jgi:exopolysaccharide production protein ExoF
MLDSTKSQRSVLFEPAMRSIAPEPWRDGIGFRIYLAKIRQQGPLIVRLLLVGAVMVWLASVAYILVRTTAFSASSELLISNTTLQQSGPDAVVTQLLVENSLVQSAIEMAKSSRVLERAVDRLGLEKIELILPKSRSIRDLGPLQIFAPERESSETSRRQTTLAVLKSNITVNRVGTSQIIAVRARALTAEDAAKLTNEIAESFVQEQNDTSSVVTTSAAVRERIKVLGPTARIISAAVPPGSKDGPTAGVMFALAAILGAALGGSVGLAIVLFDRRVRTAEQLVMTSAECFGYLPRMMGRRGLRQGKRWPGGGRFGAWMLEKLSHYAPYARNVHYADLQLGSDLRGAVLRRARSAVLERRGDVPRFVGITSCRRAEGKTTVAAHWAGLIAGDGSRVLLVDASNAAALSNSLTPSETQGLYQLLRGGAVLGEVIQAEMRPNLDFLPSGQAVGNIDMQWHNLVHAVTASGDCAYEWVILDLPALTPVADVRSAGQIVDELLIVVEWGRTSEVQLVQALQSLGPVRDKVLGVVINKTPWALRDPDTRVDQRPARDALEGKGWLWKWFCEISIISGFALAVAGSPAFGDEYRLGISDRLKIKVQEWPDIGGEYAVTTDGLVSLPLIGGVKATGLHVKDLAQEISDRLQRRGGGVERPFTAVEIVQFRPFSILGDVQRPGEYPYRPGLTVIQAISAAGGYYRPDGGLRVLRLDRDIALAKGDIRTLSLKQNRLVVRAARLTAALAGQENVPTPPELANEQDDATVSAIIESERAALARENDTARSEASAFEDIKSLYQREIDSLRGQVEALKQEKGTIEHQLNELRSLSARGLALAPTLFTLERSLAQITNQQMAAETEIVRAGENITLAEQRVREHALERSRTNTRDLQLTKDEIAEVRARIGTADDLLKEAQFSAPAEVRERLAEKGERPSVTLLRKDGEITREITAEETTLIEPNDIIKVPTIRPKPLASNSYINLSRAGPLQKTEP